MGIMAGIGGLVGGLGGLFGGGTSQPSAPPTFTLPNMGGAASNLYSGIQGLQPFTNVGTGALGPAQSTFSNLYNNPYAGGFQGGANFAGGLGQNAALGAYGTGGTLQNAGLGTLPWASQLFQSGFDPQQALYSRTAQQLTDQTRAGLEARGLDNTPYGAGIEGQTMSNFNIDWQNNLLQRQLAGASGAGSLLTQGGNLANLGTGIQNLAPGQFLNASGMPYSTYGQIGGNQNAAINSLLGIGTSGANLANVQNTGWSNYLGTGTGLENAATANYQAQLNAQKQQFGEQMQLGQMLGGSLYGLGQAGFGFGTGNNSFFPSYGGQNPFLPGGTASPFSSYINPSGDLISGGQVQAG